ncbi:cytochrome P450 [Glycomyces harbinensis]|uniref:Cytochrome P450 n=1 Tax=Glycomyces harbinensis TaxID=58114 RepID=A0A1G7AAX6_9ACTN|nr:cytochrome P450 [Glycomyces harbinensis]SDE12108.1 Cytochrome P450 [Glycomyces harbinensis]
MIASETASSEDLPHGMPYHRDTRHDPPAALMALQDQPLRRMRYYPDDVEGWLVTGHALARQVLADPRFLTGERFVRSPTDLPHFFVSSSEHVPPGFFFFKDPPEHTRLRRKVTGVFTLKRMRDLEPRIADIVDDRIAAMKDAGSGADLFQEFALPVPSLVICEMLGVPYADRDHFQRTSSAIFDQAMPIEQRNEATGELFGYVHGLVPAKRARPGDDLLSTLAADDDLTDDEVAGIGMILLLGGHETTAHMFGLGTLALLEHPDQLARLRSEPELMTGAVEELLRFLTVAHAGMMRIVKEDAEIDGRILRAGEYVTVAPHAVNRDPAYFDRPDELDLGRNSQGHMAFGHGIHQCIGQQLARVEMRIGFARLLEAFPGLRLAVPADQVPLRTDMFIYGVGALPVAW